MTVLQAENLGYDAGFHDRCPVTENPYEGHPAFMRLAWARGYYAGQRDFEQYKADIEKDVGAVG